VPRSDRRRLLTALALAVAAAAPAAPAPAPAPAGWAASFSPEAVRAAFLDGPVAVVPGSPSAVAPASALADALRRSSRPLRVIDAPRPSTGHWTDEMALEAAGRSGADQVAVVRVYPGAQGGAQLCTVAIYRRDRSPLRSFYVPQGQPVVRAPPLVPGGGASPVEGVARYVDEAFVRSHYLDFQETVALQEGVKVGHYASPIRGDQRQGLWWDEFYRTVGREDLAGRSAALGSMKITLALAAVGCAAASFAGGFISYISLQSTFQPGIVGPVLFVGGILGATVFGLWSAGIHPMVLGMEENRRLADEYNQKLKRGEIHGALGAAAPGLQLSLLPATNGLLIQASF